MGVTYDQCPLLAPPPMPVEFSGKTHVTAPEASQANSAGGDFFIVDNSDEHWKALEYLRQWCRISSAVDIATGYFEVGALLALDGEWQKVDKIRILIGAETSRQTVEALREARRILDASLDRDRQSDPFLEGLDGVVEGIASGKIEIRVYRKKKFHAKAYITHGRLEVVGSAALVGSSNFTHPGLVRNVELNVRFNGVEVRELQNWFLSYWDDAEEATGELLEVMERHNRPTSPFEVYAKALQVLTDDVDPSAVEWEREDSKIYPKLAPYQREAYHGLKQRAAQWRGAFLTDGVGLGKTFVGLMLAEYYAVQEKKNVLIMATKTGQDAVWEPELEEHLPELSGEFTNVRVMAHTDLSTQDALERVERLAKRVDVVIVDEAHNFRNHGPLGEDEETPKSRWWRLQKICEGKTVFLLTATPVNNGLFDFVHEFELFTGLEDGYFSSIGISSVRSYISSLEKAFVAGRAKEEPGYQAPSVLFDLEDFEEMMKQDQLREALIVQNTREYAQLSAKAAGGEEVLFPDPDLPRAIPYSYNLAYMALLGEMELAFERKNPLFTLPLYYPLAYAKGDEVDTKLENRQRQVVGLIRTTFLKRFESSIAAFAGSCVDLATKVAQWIVTNSHEMPEYADMVAAWDVETQHLRMAVHAMFRSGDAQDEINYEDDGDGQLFGEVDEDDLTAEKYDLRAMFDAALDDLRQLSSFMKKAIDVGQVHDDKYNQLLALLKGGTLAKGRDPKVFDRAFSQQKVLVFTEYADTAKYLHGRLVADGLADVDRLDGSRKGSRLGMIQRFAPHYNKVKESDRKVLKPLRVLVSTDVLSEGVNLQDASCIVNYDIHWNPVRLMQRIGRVDRRMNADIEKAIIAENPKVKKTRGIIKVRNFLPPGELNLILSLYSRVQSRVLLISKTLGIPGGKLLDEHDMLDDVKVFKAFLDEYRGELSPLEALRLKYLDLIAEHPGLEELLADMPHGVHAARESEPAGLFMCSIEPIRTAPEDETPPEWTLEDGRARWAYRSTEGVITTDITEIDGIIRCEPETHAASEGARVQVRDALRRWQEDRHKELMKETGLPLDAPNPLRVAWMEVR